MIIGGSNPQINGISIFVLIMIGGLPLFTIPWIALKLLPFTEFNYSRLVGSVLLVGLIGYIYSDYITGLWATSIFYYLFHFIFILALLRISPKYKSN
jgi:hypothetical protein